MVFRNGDVTERELLEGEIVPVLDVCYIHNIKEMLVNTCPGKPMALDGWLKSTTKPFHGEGP